MIPLFLSWLVLTSVGSSVFSSTPAIADVHNVVQTKLESTASESDTNNSSSVTHKQNGNPPLTALERSTAEVHDISKHLVTSKRHGTGDKQGHQCCGWRRRRNRRRRWRRRRRRRWRRRRTRRRRTPQPTPTPTAICTCSNGYAVQYYDCPSQGYNKCSSCHGGFHVSGYACVANVCTCSNGIALSSPDCTINDGNMCGSCHTGFHLNGVSCVSNTCTCPNGQPVTGTACHPNQAHLCDTCNQGWHKVGNVCTENVCSCANGMPADGPACTANGSAICASCDDDFFLNGVACNACDTCSDTGIAMKTQCTETSDSVCQCNRGYIGDPVGGSCSACEDTNFQDLTGQPACKKCAWGSTGESDVVGGGNTKCKTDTCNRPSAPTHAAIDEAQCPDEGTQNASTCALRCVTGYTNMAMVPFTCAAVTGSVDAEYQDGSIDCAPWNCTCENGNGSKAANCPADQTPHCAKCNAGYHKEAAACVGNACVCENGQGAVLQACPVHQAEKCATCNPGYLFDATSFSCQARQCICVNGNAATGGNCPENGIDKCASCNSGFSLDDDACSANQCVCDNGAAIVGKGCSQTGAQACVSCNEGFELVQGKCQAPPPVDGMPCTDPGFGFINHGTDVTGFLISCSVTHPHVEFKNKCADTKCHVDPDRETCCIVKQCTCPNGNATVPDGNADDGTLCESNGDVDCSSCGTGFHLSAAAGPGTQTCVPNVCTCDNGQATTYLNLNVGEFCAEHGQNDCAACNPGYTLSSPAAVGSQTCTPNSCTCSNGVASVAWGSQRNLCETNGNEDCDTCNPGYALSSPAQEGSQLCEPKVCSSDSLPTGMSFDNSECVGIKTGQSCDVGCAAGYSGKDTKYVCGTDSQFNGTSPNCTAIECNEKPNATLFTAHAVTHNCGGKTTGQSCEASCDEGYNGASQTYSCTPSGFTGTPMACNPSPCNAAANPDNGLAGDCTSTLASSATCKPKCNEGYTLSGVTSCNVGILTPATCEPSPCPAGQSPDDGGIGDCARTLQSGENCSFTCSTGYSLSGVTTCLRSVLTPGTCNADLRCALEFGKVCNDNYGYWTVDPDHLDYEGCERYCNAQNAVSGVTILGCELTNVPLAARSTKGKYCLAHVRACSVANGTKNAAAACVSAGNTSNEGSAVQSSLAQKNSPHKHHRRHA